MGDGGREVLVLLVDDDPFVRRALRSVVEEAPGLGLAGEAGDGREAVAAVARVRPDVVVMDLAMPSVDGVEATRLIRTTADPPPVLVLTNRTGDEHVLAALEAGASGFLVKDTRPADLVSAVRNAHEGEAVLSSQVVRRLVEVFVDRGAHTGAPVDAWAQALTAREREVAEAVAEGESNRQVAERLSMSLSTVKTNVSRILAKLQLDNRVQLALLVHGVMAPRRG